MPWIPRDSSTEILKGVSFNLRRGEILGIAGLMGSGRTELVMTLFGEYGKITQGKIKMEGQEITIHNSRQAMSQRHQPGTRRSQTARIGADPIHLAQYLPGQPGSILLVASESMTAAELKESTDYAKSLAIKASNLHAMADSLSGGNQQKVVISKWLMSQPKGVDHGRSHTGHRCGHQI